MRLGLFGGSFDPVHYGHLLLAETCREQAELDAVWFVPAAVPPHKTRKELAPDKARVEMLELALAGDPRFVVSAIELERGGVSYTIDTLTTIHEQQPEAELYFLMGADSLRELPTWRDPAGICRLATPLVVRRGGTPEPDFSPIEQWMSPAQLQLAKQLQVAMPAIELSSTELRARAATGKSLRFRTPRAVEEYIRAQGLYRG